MRNPRQTRLTQPLLAAVLAAAASGCVSHASRLSRIKADIALPNYAVNTNAAPFRASDVAGSDKILALSERARAYQLTGEIEKSMGDYLAAEAAYDALDDKPVVSISDVAGKGVAGTIGNDTMLPYEGNAHERLMLYQLDAFNHISLGDWDGARAAAHNIVYLSEKARARRDATVKAAEEAAAADGRFSMAALSSNQTFRSAFFASDEAARPFIDALQNGYAYYFSAFVRETDGDYPSALIGYRRVAELAPKNSFVRRDIARLETLAAGRAASAGRAPAPPNVLVFFEEGFAPELQSFTVSFATIPAGHHQTVGAASAGNGANAPSVPLILPTGTPITAKFSLPYYSKEQLDVPPTPLVVSDGETAAVTELAGDFRALAARAFREKLPYVATRAAIRSIVKATAAAVANYAAKDRDGLTRFAALAGGLILTQLTETADLRTWLLAPRYGQVARWRSAPGPRDFTFTHSGLAGTVSTEVPASGTLLFHVMSVPGRLVVDHSVIP